MYLALSDVVLEHTSLLIVKYGDDTLQEGTISINHEETLVPEWEFLLL